MAARDPFCCRTMRAEATRTCRLHQDRNDCPDCLVQHDPASGRFGILVHDGGTSCSHIRFCPWCGSRLSRRRWGGSDVDVDVAVDVEPSVREREVQPTLMVGVTRPWQWGIAIVGDLDSGHAPAVPGRPVSGSGSALVIAVAHAQDVTSDDDGWVEATVEVVVADRLPAVHGFERVIHEGVLTIGGSGCSVGDADGDVRVPLAAGEYAVHVTAPYENDDVDRLTRVTVYLAQTGTSP